MKCFKNIDEQIEILKSRGLIIEDEDYAKKVLIDENYYNVINGYKELFMDNLQNDTFINNVKFEEIYELFKFDRKIRNIILDNILKIENSLRSYIAYHFSEIYGHDNYLLFQNFESLNNVTNNIRTLQYRASDIQSLISKLQSEIAKSIKKKSYIEHYIMNHGYVPLWVLVNTLSLGTISKFYTLMKQPERIKVSMHYNLNESDLREYIKMLAHFRNLCAHDDRIYDCKTTRKCTIPDNVYHSLLQIQQINNRYVNGKEDVFALLITLKVLLKEDEFNTMFNKIEGNLISLTTKLTTIDISQVKQKMGLPLNWRNLKNIKKSLWSTRDPEHINIMNKR